MEDRREYRGKLLDAGVVIPVRMLVLECHGETKAEVAGDEEGEDSEAVAKEGNEKPCPTVKTDASYVSPCISSTRKDILSNY